MAKLLLLLVLAALIAAWWRGRSIRTAMPTSEARALLGVPADADAAAIRAAHRRIIARVHPDAGGSAELARRANLARDLLLKELERGRNN
jgi:hypothetical protein